jgi:23S rRNA (guanosine2251-2'-O)-methyltransferase
VDRGSAPVEEVSRDENAETNDYIFGRHAAIAALEGDRQLDRIWVLPKIRYQSPYYGLLNDAKANGAVINEATPVQLDRLADGGNHQGIVIQVAAYEYLEVETLIERVKADRKSPAILVADGITDPQNLGSMIRTAEALGFQGLIIPQRRAAGITSTVQKVAAGALEHLPVARATNLSRALEALKTAGFWIYGTTAAAPESVGDIKFSPDESIAIVIGSEGDGLGMLVQKCCDKLISIPLAGKTPCLNAANAAAICLYEVSRQRRNATVTTPSPSLQAILS